MQISVASLLPPPSGGKFSPWNLFREHEPESAERDFELWNTTTRRKFVFRVQNTHTQCETTWWWLFLPSSLVADSKNIKPHLKWNHFTLLKNHFEATEKPRERFGRERGRPRESTLAKPRKRRTWGRGGSARALRVRMYVIIYYANFPPNTNDCSFINWCLSARRRVNSSFPPVGYGVTHVDVGMVVVFAAIVPTLLSHNVCATN